MSHETNGTTSGNAPEMVEGILDRPHESLNIEIKGWIDPSTPEGKVKVVKASLALRNQNGGFLVIGIDEKLAAPIVENAPNDVRDSFHGDVIQRLIAARWGYAGQGGVTMPSPGKVTPSTRGERYLDIHLKATTRWEDVPEPVWDYTLGGYQVLKKWLSYRASALLGRPLTSDEAQQFTHHVRHITAILALHEKLDTHYGASV